MERYNVTYKNTYAQIAGQSQSLEAARQLGKDADEAMEEALDLKEDDMDEATRALYESYKEAAKAMRKQAAKLSDEDLSGTAEIFKNAEEPADHAGPESDDSVSEDIL